MIHPATQELFKSAARHPSFQALLQRLTRNETGPFSLSGLVGTAKALYLALLYQATEKPMFVVVDGNKEAETLLESLEVFFDLLLEGRELLPPQLLPAFDVLPHQHLSPHNEIAEKRAVALWRLSSGKVPVTIVPVASAMFRTEPADFYSQLGPHDAGRRRDSARRPRRHLESIGYERREPVEMVGEYSLRGGIFDVFPAEANKPVRVEFFGDEIESIRQFDVESQRSVLKINSTTLLPLAEYPRSRALLNQLANAAEEADLELSNPGEVFPGWEFLVPLVRPRMQQRLLAQSLRHGRFRRADGNPFGGGPALAASRPHPTALRQLNQRRTSHLGMKSQRASLNARNSTSRNWNCSLGSRVIVTAISIFPHARR